MAGDTPAGTRADGRSDALAAAIERAALDALPAVDSISAATVSTYADAVAASIRRDIAAAVTGALTPNA